MSVTKYYITKVSWYNQLKIKKKALVGITAICFLILVGISLSIHLVNKIHEETKEIHNKWMQSIIQISEMRYQIDQIYKFETKHVAADKISEKEMIEKRISNLQIDLVGSKTYYRVLNYHDEEEKSFAKFRDDLEEYLKIHNQILEESRKFNKASIRSLQEKSKTIVDQLNSDLYELLSLNQRGELESNQIVDKSYYSLIFQMILTSFFTVVFIYLVINYTFKQFVFPLQLAEAAANRIAKGDWKVKIEYDSNDELGNFIKTFNEMVEEHRKIDAEKSRIEKEVRRSEELFRTLIEISPDSFLLIGLDFSVLWANNNMLRMFGYGSIDEIRELNAVAFIEQDERGKIASIMKSLLSSDYSNYNYESKGIRKDNTVFPIEVQLSVYQNENVNVGILTNIRDISERKLAEQALIENEERYRIITENMADVILVIDARTMKLLYVSPSVQNLTGYTVLEMMSIPINDLLSLRSLIYAKRAFPLRVKRLTAKKKNINDIYIDEIEQYKKDGTTIWTEIVSRYVYNENTKSLEVHAVMRNISERKKIEREINEKSQILAGILANMPVIVFRVNAEGLIIQSIGAGLRKMGLFDNQAVNINIFEVYSEFCPTLRDALQGEPQVFISNGLYNDGNEWYFQNYFFQDEFTGGLIGFGLDITEQMIAKKAAEAASKVKGDFLANISHEIRTPMNAIIGFTEILKGSIKDDIQKKYFENIVSSGKTLLTLINDILDLSKIESGKVELQTSSVNIKEVFSDLKNIFIQKINEKNLDFQIIINENLPPEIILDEVRFKQIFLNLLSNAIKFTEKGYIRLTARAISKVVDTTKIDLIFTVEDTGIGVPIDEQRAIFEAFTQQKGQNHAKYGGTGLGLAISSRLVSLMNGSISIKSEVGKGSIFQILLKDVSISDESILEGKNDIILEKPRIDLENQEEARHQILELDDAGIQNLKTLLVEMENDLYDEWKELSDASSINEIEEFAYKIKYLGEKYNYPPLMRYSENLQAKALLFDMNSLIVLLRTYPELIQNLRSHYVG
ncbi:MAG TPA: PAS domain S-box protein [Leptospiraceae bacterium]|nr:PAS domain S-box protein [Leptospiraceae bacterium]HNC54291.1 PAS domain S-box protein [Leptospiraceae bacterium]